MKFSANVTTTSFKLLGILNQHSYSRDRPKPNLYAVLVPVEITIINRTELAKKQNQTTLLEDQTNKEKTKIFLLYLEYAFIRSSNTSTNLDYLFAHGLFEIKIL